MLQVQSFVYSISRLLFVKEAVKILKFKNCRISVTEFFLCSCIGGFRVVVHIE